MLKEKVLKDLEELINGSIDPTLFPYQKGNSIRLGKYAIRVNKRGFYKIYDVKENRLVAEMFCKTTAIALAKVLSKGQATNKVLELDKELQKWYNDCVFYRHTILKTDDSVKREVVRVRYDIAKDKTSAVRRELDKYVYA